MWAASAQPCVTESDQQGIAQALIGQPRLIIVDEPTAGLDPEERARFHNRSPESQYGNRRGASEFQAVEGCYGCGASPALRRARPRWGVPFGSFELQDLIDCFALGGLQLLALQALAGA